MTANSNFLELHGRDRLIDPASPEMRLLAAFAAGDGDAAAAVIAKPLFGASRAQVITPFGTYEGPEGARDLAASWLDRFDASAAELIPTVQTTAGGRVAGEVVLRTTRRGARDVLDVPVSIVGDLAPGGRIEGARIYFFWAWAPGLEPFTPPIFEPQVPLPASYSLMTGALREYYEALATDDPEHSVERILSTFSDDIAYGGLRPVDIEAGTTDHERIRRIYQGICSGIPGRMIVRFETITDNGLTAAVEWTTVVTEKGRAAGSRAQAGFASYDRDRTGKLCAVRINDNVGVWETPVAS
jgi:hypothetical protein